MSAVWTRSVGSAVGLVQGRVGEQSLSPPDKGCWLTSLPRAFLSPGCQPCGTGTTEPKGKWPWETVSALSPASLGEVLGTSGDP